MAFATFRVAQKGGASAPPRGLKSEGASAPEAILSRITKTRASEENTQKTHSHERPTHQLGTHHHNVEIPRLELPPPHPHDPSPPRVIPRGRRPGPDHLQR